MKKSNPKKLFKKYCIITGMVDEAVAKGRLYRNILEKDPSRQQEIKKKLDGLAVDIDKCSVSFKKILRDWNKIKGDYGIT